MLLVFLLSFSTFPLGILEAEKQLTLYVFFHTPIKWFNNCALESSSIFPLSRRLLGGAIHKSSNSHCST